ncbi:MAG: xanthine dehydrogenase family protein molybdopterin-binding subunit [Candidatus Brocadiia bacterium]
MPEYVGQSVKKSGGKERVKGKLQFAADLQLPGLLHAKLVTLDCAHARVLSIDAADAEAMEGVHCVLTPDALPDPMPRYGPVEDDRPVLATGETKYYGEPVAVVAAETEQIAVAAAERVRVDYEELPGAYTVQDALAPGAPLVQDPALRPDSPHRETNVYGDWHYEWGAIRENDADLVIEETYRFPMQVHFAIEPHVFAAAPDEPDGVVIWSTVQHPFPLRRAVAEAMGLPAAKVRVIATEMGGAFGGKGYPKFEPLMAFLAVRAGRPVRLALSLAESFLAGRRAAGVVNMRTGFTDDGRFMFNRSRADYLIGAYPDITSRIVSKAAYIGCGAYRIPNLEVTARAVFSHTPPATAYRGFGAPQYLWALESQIDRAARRLGIDRLEMRLRNLPDKGEELIPGDTPVDGDWKQGLSMAAEAVGWDEPLPPRRGRGLAIGIKSPRPGAASQALARLHHDGSATVMVGTTEMGQGSKTAFGQIAAQTLGIPFEKVKVVSGDTGRVPFDAITASSRSTVCMGNAVVAACEDIMGKIAAMAAEVHDVPVEQVRAAGGQVELPDGSESYADVICTSYGPGEGEVVGLGEFRLPRDPDHPLGGPAPFWEIIFFATEVEVDEETGQYVVTKLVTAADIGKAINPAAVEGQDEGGSLMSVGQAMMEHLILDERGRPVNLGALDYRIPTTRDIPREMKALLVENADGPGPFGAKGVGESGAIAVAPAIAAAVSEATGASFTELPLTAERVWRRIQEKERRP